MLFEKMNRESDVRCKHDMVLETCADCNPHEELVSGETEPWLEFEFPLESAFLPTPRNANPGQHLTPKHSEKPRNPYPCEESPGVKKEKPWVLGKGAKPESLPNSLTSLHVSRPLGDVLIKEILEACPELQIIEFPPCFYGRYVVQGAPFMDLLRKRGIKAREGVVRVTRKQEPSRRDNRTWEKRRKYLQGSRQKRALEKAKALGFLEASLTERYYCLSDSLPRISLIDLANQHELNLHATRTRILGFLGFLGYPVKGRGVISYAKCFKNRYKGALLEEGERWIKSKFEEFQPIPPGLPSNQWGYFLELTRVINQDPDSLSALPERTQMILKFHFGLEDGIYRPYSRVKEGLNLGISRSRIHLIKHAGLRALGISKRSRQN